jgi:alpha-1,6-mannosyltransferase
VTPSLGRRDRSGRTRILRPVTSSAAEPTVAGDPARLWFGIGLPGLLASIALAAGAMAVGWLAPVSPLATDSFVSALREAPTAEILGKALVIAGAAGALRVWLSAARRCDGLSVAQARRFGRLALLWALPLLLAPVLFSRDVFSYITLSRLGPAGINPYEEGTGALFTAWLDGADPMWHHSPSPYGPLWTMVSSIVFHLTGADPVSALVAFRLLALLGLGLMVVFIPRLAELTGADPGRATWLAVLNPLVLFHVSASAHNDALMVGLLIAGMTLAMTHHAVAAVMLVSAAGAIKAPALLALPFVGLAVVGRDAPFTSVLAAWTRVAAIAAGTVAGVTLVSTHGFGWVGNLSAPTKVDTWLSPITALGRTIGRALEWLTPVSGDDVLTAARVVGVAISLGLVAYLALTFRRRPVMRGVTLAMLALVVLGPVMQPWYLLWVLPLVAVLPLSHRARRLSVVSSIGFSIYSVANTSATTDTLATLPDGIAVLASVLVMGAVVLAQGRFGRPFWREDGTAQGRDSAVSRRQPSTSSRGAVIVSQAHE